MSIDEALTPIKGADFKCDKCGLDECSSVIYDECPYLICIDCGWLHRRQIVPAISAFAQGNVETNLKKRKATSKKLRFEVFKRDGFTCQYCGAQPPLAVLVCDHIDPVKLGGKTTIDNLITSCEKCNQGKGATPIRSTLPRPDADLMSLELQQEIAELNRYQEVTKILNSKRVEVAELLQEAWQANCDIGWYPSTRVICKLLNKYTVEICEETIVTLAIAVGTGRISDRPEHWVPYMYGIANRLNKRTENDEN
jgi:HNH endonuclease